MQMEALADAFEAERNKLQKQRESFLQTKARWKEKVKFIKGDRKTIERAAKNLHLAEQAFERRLDDLQSVIQSTTKIKEDCMILLDKSKQSENAKVELLKDADKQISEIQKETKRLIIVKEELAKERKRLLNSRNNIMCARCQRPLADIGEMRKEGFSNLGLRTSGDGENNTIEGTHSTRLDNLMAMKQDAVDDQLFLNLESQYLQSVL